MFTAEKYIDAAQAESETGGLWSPLAGLRHYSRLYKLVYIGRQGFGKEQQAALMEEEQAIDLANPPEYDRQELTWSDDAIERRKRLAEFQVSHGDVELGQKNLATLEKSLTQAASGDKPAKTAEKKGPRGHMYTQHNLDSIVQRLQAAGTEVYLLTYAASAKGYKRANAQIRRYAAGNPAIPFIDVAAAVKVECPV